jgi:predicted amidohydrolase YtcJ
LLQAIFREDAMPPSNRLTRRQALSAGLGALAVAAVAGPTRRPARANQAGAVADLIFTGGPILTMNDAAPRAEAVAVRAGRISAVGRREDVLARKGPDTRLVDLAGRTLMPGFVEPHTHLSATAVTLDWLDVGFLAGTRTIDGVLAKIKTAAQAAKPGEWVRAWQVDPSLQSGESTITARDLDAIAPNNPVFVLNASDHLAYVNSRALAAAGVTASTPDPPHGRYQRDAGGRPNGVLEEPPAFLPFLKGMPAPTPQEYGAAVLRILEQASAAGCTAANDAGIGIISGPPDLEVMRAVASRNPPVRMTGYLVSTAFDQWVSAGVKPDAGDDRLRLIAMKFWCDGSTQGYTASLRQPYLKSNNRGMADYTLEQLTAGIRQTHGAGWQVGVHANGDAAIDMTLQAFETVLKEMPRADHRHRIEHCTLAHPEQLAKMKALGISPTFLIGHVYYWGRALRDRILGPQRASGIDPAADALKAGLRWTMHSDYAVSPIAPLRYVETAVTRVMREGGQALGPGQRVPVAAALKAVTLDAAWQCRIDDRTGSLAPGKYADLVLLERDPTAVDPTTISQIRVLGTWLAGVRRFQGA